MFHNISVCRKESLYQRIWFNYTYSITQLVLVYISIKSTIKEVINSCFIFFITIYIGNRFWSVIDIRWQR